VVEIHAVSDLRVVPPSRIRSDLRPALVCCGREFPSKGGADGLPYFGSAPQSRSTSPATLAAEAERPRAAARARNARRVIRPARTVPIASWISSRSGTTAPLKLDRPLHAEGQGTPRLELMLLPAARRFKGRWLSESAMRQRRTDRWCGPAASGVSQEAYGWTEFAGV
jgi:hypothetical protein